MKHTPGEWERLLTIVERIDATPVEDFDHDSDVLIDLNCWLMDADSVEYQCNPRIADAAPELLEAGKDILAAIGEDPSLQEQLVIAYFSDDLDLPFAKAVKRLVAAITEAEGEEA